MEITIEDLVKIAENVISFNKNGFEHPFRAEFYFFQIEKDQTSELGEKCVMLFTIRNKYDKIIYREEMYFYKHEREKRMNNFLNKILQDMFIYAVFKMQETLPEKQY